MKKIFLALAAMVLVAPQEPPPAPLPCAGHCVQLRWNEVSGATDGYMVLKSYMPCTPTPSNFIRVGVTTDTQLVDKTVKEGTAQCYLVVPRAQAVQVQIPSGPVTTPVVTDGTVSTAVQ